MSEPSIAEIVRRLDEVVRSVERLYLTLESSYVRKDVYDARHEALRRENTQRFRELDADISDMKAEAATQKSFRRQILAGVIVGLILIVAQMVIVVTHTPGGGA